MNLESTMLQSCVLAVLDELREQTHLQALLFRSKGHGNAGPDFTALCARVDTILARPAGPVPLPTPTSATLDDRLRRARAEILGIRIGLMTQGPDAEWKRTRSQVAQDLLALAERISGEPS